MYLSWRDMYCSRYLRSITDQWHFRGIVSLVHNSSCSVRDAHGDDAVSQPYSESTPQKKHKLRDCRIHGVYGDGQTDFRCALADRYHRRNSTEYGAGDAVLRDLRLLAKRGSKLRIGILTFRNHQIRRASVRNFGWRCGGFSFFPDCFLSYPGIGVVFAFSDITLVEG